MPNKPELNDYQPVTRAGHSARFSADETETGRRGLRAVEPTAASEHIVDLRSRRIAKKGTSDPNETPSLVVTLATRKAAPVSVETKPTLQSENWMAKRGHTLSYAGLFVFTLLVYFRPYELLPSLAWLSRSALVVALFTLAVFIPTQLGLENTITAKPREVKLALALLITGILSIPLALEPARAFQSFIEFFKVIAIFIVMVNVVRTEKRLRGLMLLVLLASCVLSIAALNDYRLGNLAMQGRRIAGLIGGLFSNPNDLALHLVTMIPISLALMLGSRALVGKIIYFGCSLLLMAGMVVTFSRGGFLGFVFVIGFLGWKLARRNRIVFSIVALTVVLATIAVAPGAYRSRLATTSDASALARTDDLKRSILVAARHPFFGVGMDNYILFSNVNKATHNAYTQVAAEMGFAAFLIYLGFLITPFSRLRKIEKASWTSAGRKPRLYYLAIGLQASLVGFMVVSFFASVAYLWYAYYLVAYAVCLRRICTGLTEDTQSAPRRWRNSVGASSKRDASSLTPVATAMMGGT